MTQTARNIEITDDARYNGQDMAWTEAMKGYATIPAGTELLHLSDDKIKAFYPKETCFFADNSIRYLSGHYYKLTVLKPLVALVSKTEEEIRIDLDEFKDCVRIDYLGEIQTSYDNGWIISKNTIKE